MVCATVRGKDCWQMTLQRPQLTNCFHKVCKKARIQAPRLAWPTLRLRTCHPLVHGTTLIQVCSHPSAWNTLITDRHVSVYRQAFHSSKLRVFVRTKCSLLCLEQNKHSERIANELREFFWRKRDRTLFETCVLFGHKSRRKLGRKLLLDECPNDWRASEPCINRDLQNFMRHCWATGTGHGESGWRVQTPWCPCSPRRPGRSSGKCKFYVSCASFVHTLSPTESNLEAPLCVTTGNAPRFLRTFLHAGTFAVLSKVQNRHKEAWKFAWLNHGTHSGLGAPVISGFLPLFVSVALSNSWEPGAHCCWLRSVPCAWFVVSEPIPWCLVRKYLFVRIHTTAYIDNAELCNYIWWSTLPTCCGYHKVNSIDRSVEQCFPSVQNNDKFDHLGCAVFREHNPMLLQGCITILLALQRQPQNVGVVWHIVARNILTSVCMSAMLSTMKESHSFPSGKVSSCNSAR